MQIDRLQKRAIEELFVKSHTELDVTKIILFGSRARGEATEYSDVNLLVLGKLLYTNDNKWKLSDLSAEINVKHGVSLSCLYFNEHDWVQAKKVNPFLKRKVEREGITLHFSSGELTNATEYKEAEAMRMTRQDIQELLEKIPDNKVEEIGRFIKRIFHVNSGTQKSSFHETFIAGINEAFEKYDSTLKGLAIREQAERYTQLESEIEDIRNEVNELKMTLKAISTMVATNNRNQEIDPT
ncbi:nucleotidyltransferase domain-containing protein [Aneurinibacillus sp. Ricciae_BoGa-3]|uniref:nucleotidyltransferase family protein n=1 Tax=Aneurinibacillus sp. Ricciae_BoGa-3 TaxID=3022697 RepID=UPI00233FA14E|nr:nucleotidyltransferase domain-containing protein [Aneurinibacillus sp. Ricciae_BoGa-3]WCK53894.1 nucleotidyltransferase domain-containing protein [Aneurinibacillus sp. Ricciae_BoGa-3]